MPTDTERALRRAIHDRAFDGVYYLHGDDDFLKEARARELMSAALDPATRDFNLEVLRGPEVSAESLDTILGTPPMFAERRVVVIREVSALKKEARAAVIRYLERPAPDVVLLMIDPAGVKAAGDLAGASVAVEFGELSGTEVESWIVEYGKAVAGVEVDRRAAGVLLESVGSSLTALASEIDKLASFTGGAAVGEDAVRAVVGVARGESILDLVDAVAERNAARAVALVTRLLSQPRTTAVAIIMQLATNLTAIAWGRAAVDRGMPPAGLERGFIGLLKEGKGFPGRPWGEAAAAWRRAVPRWTAVELDRALHELLLADASAKETRVSSEEQLLTSLVLSLCTPLSRVAA